MRLTKKQIDEIGGIAKQNRLSHSGLLAVTEVESAGRVFAKVNGRNEPVIRFEGHYFDRRLSGNKRAQARRAGLASPKAGRVKNPRSQAGRWALLKRAAEIDRQAAYESVSWGVGQVMGAHWAWLGYGSIDEMVNQCRSGLSGQVEVMVRYIVKAALASALRARQWSVFARGYNGPAYRKYSYHTKMAAADQRWRKRLGSGDVDAGSPADPDTRSLQAALKRHGFDPGPIDGLMGPKTLAAIRAFQKAKGLVVDGMAGSATWGELNKSAARSPAPDPIVVEKPVVPDAAKDVVEDAAADDRQSTTIWSTIGGWLVSAATALSALEWQVAIAVILIASGFAFWIIRERRRKTAEGKAALNVIKGIVGEFS